MHFVSDNKDEGIDEFLNLKRRSSENPKISIVFSKKKFITGHHLKDLHGVFCFRTTSSNQEEFQGIGRTFGDEESPVYYDHYGSERDISNVSYKKINKVATKSENNPKMFDESKDDWEVVSKFMDEYIKNSKPSNEYFKFNDSYFTLKEIKNN